MVRWIGWSVLLFGAAAFAQRPVPLADSVDKSLLPPGISKLDVTLDGPRAYVFQDDDGTSVLHFTGAFKLTLGTDRTRELLAREAIVWITNRRKEGRDYRHLGVLLWREAEIRDVGGTLTTGPALFVTVNTEGDVHAKMDDVAMQASTDSEPYRQGNALRKAIAKGQIRGLEHALVHRDFNRLGTATHQTRPRRRPVIQVRSEGELVMTQADTGGNVLTVTGGVYLSRGEAGSAERLELRADAVVVFLPSSALATTEERSQPPAGLGVDESQLRRRPASARPAPAGDARDESDRQLLAAGFGEIEVEGAYVEGDILMTQGPNMIRASRLYYDFLEERAVILDAVVRATMVERNIPLYLRAAEIRQLSQRSFAATDAKLTTSEFHTPHYHIGAQRIELVNLTPADPTRNDRGIRAGSFDVRHATLNLGGNPIFFWPHIRGNIDTSETAIKSLRTGYSDDFGAEVETDWHLFGALGFETPDGFDGTLGLDLYTRRGPAIGVDVDYERDAYFGLLRSYLLTDEERDFLGRQRERSPERDVRGRLLFRHRQYLEDDWQVSLELSYLSDDGFLEEFFESEFDQDKEQETLLYFKRQRENWALAALFQGRILDFVAQTERLPDVSYHLAGEPLGESTTWFSENRIGFVRRRLADRTLIDLLRGRGSNGSGSVARADTRQEIDLPVDLGPIRLVPFTSVRGTAWDDSPADGGVDRIFAAYGMRASLYLSRLFPDVRSTVFDLDGLRHIIKPDIVAWFAHTNRDAHELFNFDDTIENVDEVDGVTLGVRQRLQTKRGLGDNRRTVDVVTLDAELGLFNDADGDVRTNGFASFSRPENSLAHNHLSSSFIWRMNDRTALVSEFNYDINDGEVDILNVSIAVERSPRFSYLLGYRFIEETNSNLLGFDMNYRMTEKHSLAIRELFDLARGQTMDFTVALIRKFPRWFGAVSFALDESEDDFGVSLSIWPEGLPQATLGSKRFTGVTNITRLRRY